jgi:hypothetical protein
MVSALMTNIRLLFFNVLRTVRTKILHTFLLAGGSSGRLTKGDEVIEMEFRHGMVSEDEFLFAESMTPR